MLTKFYFWMSRDAIRKDPIKDKKFGNDWIKEKIIWVSMYLNVTQNISFYIKSIHIWWQMYEPQLPAGLYIY